MKFSLEKLTSSSHVLKMDDCEVLFSFNFPAGVLYKSTYYILAQEFRSFRTTSVHIAKWLGNSPAENMSQEKLENVVGKIFEKGLESFAISSPLSS